MKTFFSTALFLLISFQASAQLVDKIKAQVGEDILLQADFKSFKKQVRLGLLPSDLLPQSLDRYSKQAKSSSVLLEDLVTREMISQKIPEEQRQMIESSSVKKLFKKQKGKLSNKAFLRKLKSAGFFSFKEYKAFLRESLVIDIFLKQKLVLKVSVSSQELESAYFKKYKKKLFQEFEYEFVSILFEDKEKELVLNGLENKKITDLKQVALLSGLKLSHSRLKESELSLELRKELAKLSVSQISPIFLKGSSYYVVQLKWKSPLVTPAQEKLKRQLEEVLYKEKLKEEAKQWIQAEKKQVFIKMSSL